MTGGLWKVNPSSHEMEYLAKEMFKQIFEGEFWQLLSASRKIQEEKNNFKTF